MALQNGYFLKKKQQTVVRNLVPRAIHIPTFIKHEIRSTAMTGSENCDLVIM